MPLLETRGAASVQGFGALDSAAVNYIEEVFSTYLYTGTAATQTITNGIDLAGKGGMIWLKQRNSIGDHGLLDTARGAGNVILSNSTAAQTFYSNLLSSFNSNGFTLGSDSASGYIWNGSPNTYASWTFRKQPKFFDVVTYTGDGVAGRTVAHSLGSTPGCIIVKRTNSGSAENWRVYHRSLGAGNYLSLNLTDALAASTNIWYDTAPTSSVFSLGASTSVNANGGTYVAYLFAHDAGGFGLSGSDNVISCGSFTTDGSENSTTNLGYEPQWLLLKASSGATSASQPWRIFDNMRGLTVAGQDDASLQPNNSNAESQVNRIGITSTGFTTNAFGANETFIYIAIRRGPMKTPTTGTSVFSPNAVANDSSAITTNFPVDGYWEAVRTGNPNNFVQQSRLTGGGQILITSSTAAENNTGFTTVFQNNTGYTPGTFGSSSLISYAYRRAPGFFDVVCYTGNGATSQTVNHNLGVVPEMVINKSRSVRGWTVFRGNTTTLSGFLRLNETAAAGGDSISVSSTTITPTLGAGFGMNANGENYVTYLFASLPGISKVGTYTGNGTSQTINCGFTGGSRFVLIKRTDSTGNWTVFDSARGIVAGNDSALYLNSTAAEVTTIDAVDTDNSGFIVNQDATLNLNVNAATYIFLAIA